MSVEEIEQAIEMLKPEELNELATWFANHHGDKWDEQIANDVRAGRLDALGDKAIHDFDAGRIKRL